MVRRLIRVLQWRRLKDAHLVLVRSGNLTRVRAAVQGRDANIVVHCSGDDLHPLEVARQYHYVASCGVGLERGIKELCQCQVSCLSCLSTYLSTGGLIVISWEIVLETHRDTGGLFIIV